MKIGDILHGNEGKAYYELLKSDMTNKVILKKSENEIIERFNYKKEIYSAIFDLNIETNKLELTHLLRLYNH